MKNRSDNFSYLPQFTLVIVGNHAPELATVNEANRRRFQIIPFNFRPKKPDEELPDKLRPEWPAILAWMIQGARDWYHDGLGKTPKVGCRLAFPRRTKLFRPFRASVRQFRGVPGELLRGTGFTDKRAAKVGWVSLSGRTRW
jgi:hypothetical protein